MSTTKLKCCECEEDCSGDANKLSCKGVVLANGNRVHLGEKWYHHSCADTQNWSASQGADWLCSACKEKTGGYDYSATQAQAGRLASDLSSHGHSQTVNRGHCKVKRILQSGNLRENVLGVDDILHFELEWEEPATGSPYPDETVPSHLSEADIPERKYYAAQNLAVPEGEISDEDRAAGNPWLQLLSNGYWNLLEPLAKRVMQHAAVKPMPHTLDDMKAEIFVVLTSVPVAVLYGVCGAGVRVRKAKDENLYAWLVQNLVKAKDRPAIYTLEFTDQIGRAPTIEDMLIILDDIDSYLRSSPSALDAETIVRIDSAGGQSLSRDEKDARRDPPDNDNRRYLTTGRARKNMEELVASLRREINNLLQRGMTPTSCMPFVRRDIGYTIDGRSRLKAQENLTSASNPLMSLFNAIAQSNVTFLAREKAAEDADPDSYAVKYRMHGDVIFLSFRREHAALGEIVFSILAQSYIAEGRGFNGAAAGVQNTSNNTFNADDFEDWEAEIWAASPMEANHAREAKRVEELRRTMQETEALRLKAELHALETIKSLHEAERRLAKANMPEN